MITDKWEPAKWFKLTEPLFIFDSAEEIISTRLFDMHADKDFTGLVLFKDKETYMFTATLSLYWRKALVAAMED